MKLRILDDSIRLRLTRSEVNAIRLGQVVDGHTRFADGQFDYELRPASVDAMSASLDGGRLRIDAPEGALRTWAGSETVTLDCPMRSDGPTILVEKDFACLSPRAGDEDTFPHPEAGKRRC